MGLRVVLHFFLHFPSFTPLFSVLRYYISSETFFLGPRLSYWNRTGLFISTVDSVTA